MHIFTMSPLLVNSVVNMVKGKDQHMCHFIQIYWYHHIYHYISKRHCHQLTKFLTTLDIKLCISYAQSNRHNIIHNNQRIDMIYCVVNLHKPNKMGKWLNIGRLINKFQHVNKNSNKIARKYHWPY